VTRFEKTKGYIQKPVVTPLSLIFLVLNLFVHILDSVTWFEALGKIFLSMGLLLSGIKISDVKEILLRLKGVMQNKELNLAQKFEQIFNIVITGCATLGVIQEEMNLYPNEYFIKKIEGDVEET
jgi:hypothetical protein